jgi:hypothetical protein
MFDDNGCWSMMMMMVMMVFSIGSKMEVLVSGSSILMGN